MEFDPNPILSKIKKFDPLLLFAYHRDPKPENLLVIGDLSGLELNNQKTTKKYFISISNYFIQCFLNGEMSSS